MIIDINEYVDFLCKSQIDPNQFLICWLIYNKDRKNSYKYISELKRFKVEDILELEKKGYLANVKSRSDSSNTLELDDYITTQKFDDFVIIDKVEIGEEFWNFYLKWIWINGSKVSAKSCDKDEFIENYAKKIKNNKKKHLKIMEIYERYKKENLYADMKIDKFIGSEHWENLEDLYKNNSSEIKFT